MPADLGPSAAPGAPSSGRRAGCRTPGVSAGTMNIDARWCGRASGSVTAMTMRKSAIEAFEENHLWPSMTHSSPSQDGARRQQRRVGAGARLGHRERRAEVAGEQRVQPALLLLVGAGQREDLGVARVRRLVAERDRRVAASVPRISCMSPRLDLAEALAAEVGREVRRPQPALLDPLLQRGQRAVELRRARGRASRAARSPRGRTRPSSRAAPGRRGRWRSPRPCGKDGRAHAARRKQR